MAEGDLISAMKKVRLVVIDHPHTSFIEALTINVPCVLYWDRDVYLMDPDQGEDLNLLRDAGILYDNPLEAARKVNEINDDSVSWWKRDKIQAARTTFCRKYAYVRKDWIDVWSSEFKKVVKE